MTEEQNFTWIDKVIDIHRKHGLKDINIHKLRIISKEDALEASKYLYNDYMANSGKLSGLGEAFGSQLEKFDRNEKDRAIGALFEMVEKCEEKKGDVIDNTICSIKQITEVAKAWDLDRDKLIRAYTIGKYY